MLIQAYLISINKLNLLLDSLFTVFVRVNILCSILSIELCRKSILPSTSLSFRIDFDDGIKFTKTNTSSNLLVKYTIVHALVYKAK